MDTSLLKVHSGRKEHSRIIACILFGLFSISFEIFVCSNGPWAGVQFEELWYWGRDFLGGKLWFALSQVKSLCLKYQPSGEGVFAHHLQCRSACKKQNGHLVGPEMADRVWKGVYPSIFGRSCQLCQRSFFLSKHSFYKQRLLQRKKEKKKRKE